MSFKKLTLTFICIFSLVNAYSKNDSLQVIHNSWTFYVGEERIADTYISPLEYKGITYSLKATHGSTYRSNHNISWEVHHKWKYAATYNPAFSSLITHGAVNIGFNTLFNWQVAPNLYIGAGGEANINAGIKSIPRNVNNNFSLDISANINAALQAKYVVETKPVNLIFQYNVTTPIIGAMFVPQYGQPYYFIYTDFQASAKDVLKLSSFHNHYGATGTFNFDLAFNGFTLRTSFFHDHRFWHANKLYFHQKELAGGIGIILNTNLFWGKKH